MRAVLLALLAGAFVVGQASASRPPTVLEVKHYFRGCHVFSKNDRPTITVKLRRGDRVQIVDHDVMDFDVTQLAGPRVGVGDPRLRRSEVRMLVFRRAGLYRFEARNVQTAEELGLQTLGPDHTLRITVRVVA